MLELDIHTLLVITALVSVGSTIALIGLWRSQTPGNGTIFWAVGMLCISVASLLMAAHENTPEFFSLVVANSLYVLGFVFISRGIRIFTGRSPLLLLDFGLPLIAVLLFYYAEQNMNARIIIRSSAFAIICFTIVLTLLNKKYKSSQTAKFAVAIVFGLFGFAHGVYGLITLLPPLKYSLLDSNIYSSLTFLGGIFLLGGSAATLILLAQENLASELRIVSSAIKQSASSVMITDTSGAISYVNPAFSEHTGYSQEEVVGKNPRILRSGKTTPDEYETLWKTLVAGDTWRGEFHNRKKNGELFWEIASIAPVKQKNGKVSHFVAIKEDITALKDAEKQIRHLANHDTLTGLPTRRLAMDRLLNSLALAKRNKTKVAVVFIDIDGFKTVNDTLGHNAGDLLLKEIATRLLTCVREADTVARIGGDEFLLLLTHVIDKNAICPLIKKMLSTLATPYKLESNEANISASVGIALYPDHGMLSEELVKLADQAMYQVKHQGKNNYAFAKPISTMNIDKI